jgi:hypothetical protein
MAAQKANFQHPEDSAPKRPYGLTEDAHLKLYRTRNVLRLFQHMNEDKHLSPPDPELVGDFHCLLADLLDQVLASAEAGEFTPSTGA